MYAMTALFIRAVFLVMVFSDGKTVCANLTYYLILTDYLIELRKTRGNGTNHRLHTGSY